MLAEQKDASCGRASTDEQGQAGRRECEHYVEVVHFLCTVVLLYDETDQKKKPLYVPTIISTLILYSFALLPVLEYEYGTIITLFLFKLSSFRRSQSQRKRVTGKYVTVIQDKDDC